MSNQIKEMVGKIISWYAVRKRGLIALDPYDIPENDLNNLAALILSQDDNLSSESNGPDNTEWEKSMLPALIRTMKTQKTGYSMEEFHDVWTSGVRSYAMPIISRLIDESLKEINEDRTCHTSLTWDRTSEKVIEIRSRM